VTGSLLPEHPFRAAIQAEMHARPFLDMPAPRVILRQVFLCGADAQFQDDHRKLSDWCEQFGCTPPGENSRHHSTDLGGARLTWERHTEFVTLTWDCPGRKAARKELESLAYIHTDDIIASPVALLSAVVINLRKTDLSKRDLDAQFSKESLCMSNTLDGRARILSDFKPDAAGFTTFTVINRSLDALSCGVLTRHLLEIETYRALSLFGFQNAKQLAPELEALDATLIALTDGIDSTYEPRQALEKITDVAQKIASLSVTHQYRLSATRAYYELVLDRITWLDERAEPGYSKIRDFLSRRLAPAMRTCVNIETRISNIEGKLDHITALLRTKIDMQMQVQNNRLLDRMNERAEMQYRLQRTVEGLSIAAVSYYVVGLLSFLFKGLNDETLVSNTMLTALSVPVVIIIIALFIRKIRASHS